MPKLYFRYGTMNSSKTANLLMVSHNYKSQGKKVILIKPKIDTRFDTNIIKSRAGFQDNCDILLDKNDNLLTYSNMFTDTNCILVDEAQFLTSDHVEQLRELTNVTPVICYGLRTDYMSNLFSGSKRLMELADSIEEIKTTCINCNKKATINAKFINNEIIYFGSSEPDIGAEEKYKAMCWSCWSDH